jgi:AraC family ethanolamine operon transcriptional activator
VPDNSASRPIEAAPALLGWPGARKALEVECVRRVVRAVGPARRAGAKAGAARRRRVVRRAEDYLRAHPADPVTVLDLCGEVGVSERTLHYAFQEVVGLSPMAYFKAQRLNGLREDLKAADPGAVSVAGAARRWGFWHTGNLAADYQRLFGELPSETLGQRYWADLSNPALQT